MTPWRGGPGNSTLHRAAAVAIGAAGGVAMNAFRFALNPKGADLSRCSAVLRGVGGAYHVASYRTTLSVKSVARGAALYTTPQGRFRITAENFLILNEDQEYGMEIGGPGITETLCPFFQKGLLGHVADSLSRPHARQLDDPEPRAPAVGFHERLYPKNGAVGRALSSILSGARTGSAGGWIEDDLFRLARALLRLQGIVAREMEEFPGSRASTREELYRRLHRGREFLRASFDGRVSVAQAADAAHLSLHHFHHMFRRAFGETPMRFLREERLSEARRLLTATDEEVTSVALAVGFESLGSFTTLFHRRFGMPPGRYRASRRKTGLRRAPADSQD